MDEIKKAGKKLDQEIALLKFRWIGTVVIILALGGALVYVLLTDRIVVVHPHGGIWEAQAENRTNKEVLYIEADDHIRKFYSTFLSFTHLDIESQTTKAYSMGGNIIKEFYNNLKDQGFYHEIVVNNYRVNSTIIKSTLLGVNGDRVKLEISGEMTLENDYIRETRNMNMIVVLVIVGRVPVTNPHGLSIENIELPQDANATINKENL